MADGLGQPASDAVPADPVAEAFRTWLRVCTRSGWNRSVGSETVPVGAARGRVTDAPIRARWSVPAYRAAAMDGIAVTLDALPPVSAANAAGRSTIRLDIDDFDYVDTGDPIPAGRDAVIMREQVTVDGGGAVIIDVTERLRRCK